MKNELKPCPFCGDNDAVIKEGEYGYQVKCDKCSVYTPILPRKEYVINKWNERQLAY